MARLSSRAEDDVNLTFIAFGRVEDGVLLASWAHPDFDAKVETEETFTKILYAAKVRLAPGQRQRLMWESSAVSIVLNHPSGDILYGVVSTTFDYPERLAYQLLHDLAECVEGKYSAEKLRTSKLQSLTKDCWDIMDRLCTKYQNPEAVDKLTAVQNKALKVQAMMKNNIRQMVNNTEQLEIMDDAAEAMEISAKDYREGATEMKQYFWWKDAKVTLLLGGLGVAMVLLLVYFIFIKSGGSPRPGTADVQQSQTE